jgi:5-amino-6-(5-phosphoribosylamino)uracil reductase
MSTIKVINVMAVSLDGQISVHETESDDNRRGYNFTNKDDQDHVREQLMQADAVITGANSMRASGGAWTVRNKKGQLPTWVVVSNHNLDSNLRFWKQSEIPRWIVSQNPLTIPKESGVINPNYGKSPMPSFILSELSKIGVKTVLLFGGGSINAQFYQMNLVDELKLTVCPLIVGSKVGSHFINPTLPSPRQLRLLSSHVKSSHVFLNYIVLK